MNNLSPAATSDWTWLGLNAENWIAIVGAFVAAASLVVAGVAVSYAKKSADASAASAKAAQKSADEAATMSKIDQERRRDEREQLHRELHPTSQTVIVAALKGPSGSRRLVGSISVDREVRVLAEAILASNATAPIHTSKLLLPNRAYEFHIEDWPEGQKEPKTDEVVFKFWPPVPAIDGVDWTCQCGRPTVNGASEEPHWAVRLPVSYKRPPRVRGF